MTCHESLSKPRRQLQKNAIKTLGLMSRQIVVHVRCTSLYISLPSFERQREMAKFCKFLRTRMTVADFENVLALLINFVVDLTV